MFSKNTDHGSGLLQELHDTFDSIEARGLQRSEHVKARLAALEAEAADLRAALRKIETARKAA